jgi:outer membrane scaffolding protein for murein synthesis (MipA/OmpV family)
MKRILNIYLFIFLGSLFLPMQLKADEGKLELGAGPFVVVGNHYRGSDQVKVWVFPLPYFSYRSERIEAEPSFIRGILFHNRWFAFKLSLVPGLNVESKNNRARAGMPSLDYSLEVGPMAIARVWENEEKSVLVNFEIPVRESIATNLKHYHPAGLITVPYLNLIYKPRERDSWSFDSEFSVSPMFASQKYHDRFYTIAQEFQQSGRPAYRARGGYSGLQSAVVLNKRLQRMGILSFFRWDYLKGAAFIDSPLVVQKNFFIGGLGIFWMFD